MTGTGLSPEDVTQVGHVVRLVHATLGDAVLGASLHGSAVAGGLRASSDLDVLAVADRGLDDDERRSLVRGLLDVSGRRARGHPGRPVELTVVRLEDVRPWRHPATADFQYGEWLRADYEAGLVPSPRPDDDLALLLHVARRAGPASVLAGQPPGELLDPVPTADLVSASLAGIPALLADLADDTRNVLLTLARVVVTVTSGDVVRKDEAAHRVLPSLDATAADSVRLARDAYRGGVTDDGTASEAAARHAARALVALAERPGDHRP